MPSFRRFKPRCFRANRIWCVSIAGIFLLGYFLFIPSTRESSESWERSDYTFFKRHAGRKVLEVNSTKSPSSEPEPEPDTSSEPKDKEDAESGGSIYPKDLFSTEERANGAIILHLIGVLYMFMALAIVCDEFFVPALGVITEKLEISEDVAGATFMAAGGSAPELFTSLIGTFFSKNDVGIGTIVGSAVFNILFVIGMCSFASLTILTLTWWPLFRDVCFYSISLMFLIIFFQDSVIEVHESFVLFGCYIAYVVFMKFNEKIETKVFKCLGKEPPSKDDDDQPKRRLSREPSIVFLGPGSLQYRQRKSIAQLLFNDPESEENIKRSSLPGESSEPLNKGNNNDNPKSTKSSEPSESASEVKSSMTHNTADVAKSQLGNQVADSLSEISNQLPADDTRSVGSASRGAQSPRLGFEHEGGHNQMPRKSQYLSEDIAEESPLDMTFPEGHWERFVYIALLPIIGPLWLTLPDVRRDTAKKWFVFTFAGSIMWIGCFSFAMVWWANTVGETIGVSAEIMGITLLAAGTSVPDLITSVIVAKKGFGDMAVSSSVGSNIFDITVGLPVPWLLQAAAMGGQSYDVSSRGLFCSIILLFGMLIAVILCIALSDWKMKKSLGLAMMALYLVFVVFAILLTKEIIDCDNITDNLGIT